MENKNPELENLQKEVVAFYSKLEKELGIDICYKIFFSKFSENADILFIGINPGAGEQIKSKDVANRLEYIDESINEDGNQINNYALAKETINLFELAGYPRLLHKLDDENKIMDGHLNSFI